MHHVAMPVPMRLISVCLPCLPGAQWHLAVDTFGETPHDLFAAGEEPLLQYPQTYLLKPRSSAILLARKPQSPVGGGSK